MKKIHLFFMLIMILIVTSCGHQKNGQENGTGQQLGESMILADSQGKTDVGRDLDKAKVIESTSYNNYDSSMLIVKKESLIRKGYLIDIQAEYPQFYPMPGYNENLDLYDNIGMLNKCVIEKIFYEELVGFYEQPFQAKIIGDITLFRDELVSVSFSGAINDNGLNVPFLSSLTFDIETGAEIGLFDVVEIKELIDKISNDEFEIEPIEFVSNRDAIRSIIIEQIETFVESAKSFENFYVTSEEIVVFVKLSPNTGDSVLIKIPYHYE